MMRNAMIWLGFAGLMLWGYILGQQIEQLFQ